MALITLGLGGIVLLLVAVVAIGLSMPERYAGRSEVTYAKPVEAVWDALLDYDKHPMTGKMKRSVQAHTSKYDMPAWIEDMGSDAVTVETIEAVRPHHMVREMTSKAVPMTSRWQYTLEPAGEGCTLAIDAATYIRSGTWHVPIFRVMMVLGGGVKKGLDDQMDMVAATLGVEAQRGSTSRGST